MKLCSDKVAFIPARADSKRLKGKNTMHLGGDTLIARTVNYALRSKLFTRIVISTDIDPDVLEVTETGNVDILKRSEELSADDISTDDVIRGFIESDIMNNDTIIMLLQVTSPLRNEEHMKKAMKLYEKTDNHVVSVNRITNPVIIDEDIITSESGLNICRQNGALFIFRVKEFIEHNCIPITGATPFYMNEIDSIDIDYEYQYSAVKAIAENK